VSVQEWKNSTTHHVVCVCSYKLYIMGTKCPPQRNVNIQNPCPYGDIFGSP